jgi:hypothetical protein
MDHAQESRTEKVAIAVTKTEKAAVRAIAALRETDESNLCRSVPIAEIVAEYRRLQSVNSEASSSDRTPEEDARWAQVRADELAKRRVEVVAHGLGFDRKQS